MWLDKIILLKIIYRSPQKYKLWCNSVQLTFPTEKVDLPSLVEKPSKFHNALCRLSLVPIAKKVNFHLVGTQIGILTLILFYEVSDRENFTPFFF